MYGDPRPCLYVEVDDIHKRGSIMITMTRKLVHPIYAAKMKEQATTVENEPGYMHARSSMVLLAPSCVNLAMHLYVCTGHCVLYIATACGCICDSAEGHCTYIHA